MSTNAGTYGQTTAGSTTLPPTPATPIPTGTFPSTPTGQGLGLNGTQVAQLSVADFLSNYDISSTEQNTYLTDTNGKLSLNANAIYLMQYEAMDQAQRQDLQQSLVNAGLMSASSANGIKNSTATSAFKSAITNAAATGTDVDSYLQQYTGTNYTENLLGNAISSTEKEATTPTSATVENPTTLAATITAAANQALGYSPNQSIVNSFISQIQGQDVANAQAPHDAAEQQLKLLQSDQSQLSKMGPNDIDAIISAYTSAIHGTNSAAGDTANPQGVATGSQANPASSQYLTPGTPLPPDTTVGINPSGTEMLANVPPTITSETTQQPNQYGVLGAIKNDLNPMTLLHPSVTTNNQLVMPGDQSGGTHPVTTTTSTPGKGMSVAPNLPAGLSGTTPLYGGIYALNAADWAEAQKLNPQLATQAKKNDWTSAGQAPATFQHTALTSLLTNLYDNNGGNWANAIVSIAGGTPGKAASETVPGSKANLNTFAVGVANDVEQQLTQLNSNIQNQSVTVKTAQPDAAAEAAQAAKESDPSGYYASNYASWGGLLSKMLYGTPLTQMQSSADTFTGPIGSDTALSGGATTPVASATAPVTATTTAATTSAPSAAPVGATV